MQVYSGYFRQVFEGAGRKVRGLVTLLRRDNRLQSLPVMVDSYKDRDEDRRRGLDAGADYYLAKASFHDDALLNAVVELIGGARA